MKLISGNTFFPKGVWKGLSISAGMSHLDDFIYQIGNAITDNGYRR